MKNKLIIIFTFIVVLMGCSQAVVVDLEPNVTVFISGENEKKISLSSNDDAYKALSYWLETHQDGWYSTSGKYPGGVYVVSGQRGIQITETKVVIYTSINSEPQATHVYEIDKKDLSVIKALSN